MRAHELLLQLLLVGLLTEKHSLRNAVRSVGEAGELLAYLGLGLRLTQPEPGTEPEPDPYLALTKVVG